MDLRGKHCLVTGATGSLGARLVEYLAERGAGIRVFVGDLSRGARVGRFEVEFVQGEISDQGAVARASEGAEYVFQCPQDVPEGRRDWRAWVAGTRVVAEASRAVGARLLHVSSAAVYGPGEENELDESRPRAPADPRAEAEAEAESLVLELARAGDLAAAVVQPTVVYGPFCPWTVRTLTELKSGRAILIDGGDGTCNAVYVDDVVRGIHLAATREEAVGEAFLLGGMEMTSWAAFLGAHERMLHLENHVDLSAAEARALHARLFGRKRVVREGLSIFRERPDVRLRLEQTSEVQILLRAARLVMPERVRRKVRSTLTGNWPAPKAVPGLTNPKPVPIPKPPPIQPLEPFEIDLRRSTARVPSTKARKVLGYEPRVDFEHGMRRVAEWADWAGFLGARERVL